MINIQYTGQFGNCMFQYAFARLHAEYNQINLATHGPLELQTTPLKQHPEPSKKGHQVITDEIYYNFRINNGSKIMNLDPEYDYTFNGYFQDADLYNLYVKQIKSFFDIEYIQPHIDSPLVLIRLGDFIHSGYNSEIIHYNWYKTILNSLPGVKTFSITSNGLSRSPSSKEKEEKYLQHLIQKEDIILSSDQDPAKEFLEVMQYKTIISSNSTWSWWACFLSNAETIYTFKKFGWFTPGKSKCHGLHINNLFNIKNISKVLDNDFIDITNL